MNNGELNKSIMNYVDRCYRDAFKSEGREYKRDLWSFEYILIRDKNGVIHMQMFNKCKYGRVQGKVFYRLQRNAERLFNIIVGNTDELRFSAYIGDKLTIDPNYTEAAFKFKKNGIFISLSIFDAESDERFESEYAPRYVNLVCTANNITEEEFFDSRRENKREGDYDIPDKYRHNWEEYKKLFNETLGYLPGRGYEYICSEGIVAI